MSLTNCKDCGEKISENARACPNCGYETPVKKSNFLAGCLGLLLGPVGLWYKGHWAAGFAWLIIGTIISVATSGVAAPFLWIGMGVHAAMVQPKR